MADLADAIDVHTLPPATHGTRTYRSPGSPQQVAGPIASQQTTQIRWIAHGDDQEVNAENRVPDRHIGRLWLQPLLVKSNEATFRPMGYWDATPELAIGAFIGVIVMVALRVQYYSLMGYTPNMGPGIAYFFSPLLLLEVLIIGLPLEFAFRFWHKPCTPLQAGLVGFSYVSILSWWVFPGHSWIFFLVNPITTRGLIGLALRADPILPDN